MLSSGTVCPNYDYGYGEVTSALPNILEKCYTIETSHRFSRQVQDHTFVWGRGSHHYVPAPAAATQIQPRVSLTFALVTRVRIHASTTSYQASQWGHQLTYPVASRPHIASATWFHSLGHQISVPPRRLGRRISDV